MVATPAVEELVDAAPSARFGKGELTIVPLLSLIVPIAAGSYPTPLRRATIPSLMLLYLPSVGRWISGRPLGMLTSERNLLSFSRFQMASWTILLLSAFLDRNRRKISKRMLEQRTRSSSTASVSSPSS